MSNIYKKLDSIYYANDGKSIRSVNLATEGQVLIKRESSIPSLADDSTEWEYFNALSFAVPLGCIGTRPDGIPPPPEE